MDTPAGFDGTSFAPVGNSRHPAMPSAHLNPSAGNVLAYSFGNIRLEMGRECVCADTDNTAPPGSFRCHD